MSDKLIVYQMTDNELAELRRLIPGHRWAVDKKSGGATTTTEGKLRLWVTAFPAYSEPRHCWQLHVMAWDWEIIAEMHERQLSDLSASLLSWSLRRLRQL